MHVIVVGAGEVGSYVAELLTRHGNDVAVIETDRDRLRDLEDRLDVLVVEGSGTHPEILARAGLDRAELLVAVTSNDEVNLIAALLARHAGVARTVVRIEAEELRGKAAQQLRDAIGADLVIDPDAETAADILDLLDAPGATEIAHLAGGEVVVVGTILQAGAPLCGRRLSEIAAEYEPDWDFLVAARTRSGETVIPRKDELLQPDDHLWVVAKRKARRDVLQLLGLRRGTHRRVMLLGGGRTGEIVARRLAARSGSVTLVERNPDRAQRLAESLDGVLVIQGDITDAELLAREDAGSYDAVVALTGHDDANILSCLYAKSLGATETIATLHRLALRELLEEVGIDAALSPRTASANGVLRFVRGGVAAVATFLAADFEVIELEVGPDSPADGATICDLGLPKDALIGAFVRDGKAQIGRGRSELRQRDHVVLFVRPPNVDAVRRLFA
ncbi:MAG: Trk system potassium transporter TrkA [Acidimicrobiales bacterium]